MLIERQRVNDKTFLPNCYAFLARERAQEQTPIEFIEKEKNHRIPNSIFYLFTNEKLTNKLNDKNICPKKNILKTKVW
jgi:hypothetical protein